MSGKLKSILLSIRFQEALIFQTPTLLGLAMFMPGISPDYVSPSVRAGLASFLVMVAIFSLNDWADINLDSQNRVKRKNTFLSLGIIPKQMLYLSISLAAGGIILFATLSALHVLAALGALAFGLVYSVPVLGLPGKGIPVFSSFLHFGGTLLAFLFGALTFAPPEWRGLMVAFHPGVLITAGHLVHEVEDYEEDRLSQCQTNAVKFGRKAVFIFASLLFGFSFIILYWLVEGGFFPEIIKLSTFLYLLYAAFALGAYRAGLTRDSVRHFRSRYRILFAVVVMAMLVGSLQNKWVW